MKPTKCWSVAMCTLLLACASGQKPDPQAPTSTPVEGETAKTPQPAEDAPAPAAKEVAGPVTYDENTSAITAKVGESFVVALPANITTPFKWSLETEPNASVVKLTKQAYTDAPPAGCDGCVGYGGTATFTFECTGAGEETLNLAYRGLGKAGAPPKRTVAIHLTVE